MKKLLVLVLVLAAASLANATYLLAVSGSLVTVSNNESLIGGIDFGVAVIGDAQFSPIVFRTEFAPSSEPVIFSYTGEEAGFPEYTGGLTTITWGDPSLTPNAAGDWFTMEVTGFTPGTQILLTDNVGAALGGEGQIVTLVPEPATIAVLSLGGLLLRRKK